VAEELLDELTSWNPRERIMAFRTWLRGSLSIFHLHVLTVLETGGPLAMGRLAEALDVSVASTTGIVDRMEQRGLVERRHQEDDRRVVTVHPTQAGLDIFRDMDERRRSGLARLLRELSDDETAGFLAGLRALKRARAALAEGAASTGERGAGHGSDTADAPRIDDVAS
jgi:DNA-binding MarR family transcriptional regulator